MPPNRKKKLPNETAVAGVEAVPKKRIKGIASMGRDRKASKQDTGDSTFQKTVNFSLLQYLTEPSWQSLLAPEFSQNYFLQLEDKLGLDYKSNKDIFPKKDLIFNAFNLTPFDKVKVVILGQDPYHDVGQAHGLAFSVPVGMAIPPSLKNIYKELRKDIPGFQPPDHGCLEKWARQGILLLNATLTVEAHQANSHTRYGWQSFTDQVIRLLSQRASGLVFLLWGAFAHKKAALVDSSKHQLVLTAHPSPLSFNKFSGCKCFSQTNTALQQFGKQQIDWSL